MAKSPEEMAASMIANLKEKTGKTLDAWCKISKATKLSKHGELVKFLKSEHGITHGYANLIAHQTFKSAAADTAPDDLIAAQYSGKKAGLKPIYDALIDVVNSLGSEIEIAPKKAYASIRRNKQFAIFQPSTATRLDVGIKLKGVDPKGRLESSGSFNAMVTHRVRLESIDGVDAELIEWLQQAYDAAS